MKNGKINASVWILASSVLCFFLPFITVSLGPLKVAALTGQQLATGLHGSQALPAGALSNQTYGRDPLAGVAFLCAIAATGLSFAGRKLAALTAVSSGAGVVALVIMMSKLSDQIRAQGQGIVQISYEPGLILTLCLLAAGAALVLYPLFQRGTNLEASRGPVQAASSVSPAAPDLNADRGTTQPANVSGKARYCRHCGSPISVGKRFCSQCGNQIVLKQETPTHQAADLTEPNKPVHAAPTAFEPDASAVAGFGAGRFDVRIAAPVPAAIPIKPVPPPYFEEPVPAAQVEMEEHPVVTVQVSRANTGLWITAIVSVAVLVAAAIGTVAWQRGTTFASLTGHRNTSHVDNPLQSRVQIPPQTQGQVQTQAQIPSQAEPEISAPAAEPTAKPSPSEIASVPPQRASQRVTPVQPTRIAAAGSTESPPVNQPVPQINAEPQSALAKAVQAGPSQMPTSGALHYSGSPVHFGGIVSFSGLPGGRLRFTFDHAVWQPLISRQPNGTQTLTLRSIVQDVQTQCEVRWEMTQ